MKEGLRKNFFSGSFLLVALMLLSCAAQTASSKARSPDGEQKGNTGPVTQEDGTILSRHTIVTEGKKKLTYTARAGFIPLRENWSVELRAEIFFVAYTADPVSGAKPRPLTFVWGGGPGSSQTLSRIGPRRLKLASDPPYEIMDNPSTWLTMTDLVLIDTVGTGYSRMTKPEFASLFYNPSGDAESLTEFIRIYLKRYDVANPPIFLAGGSYGSVRCALVAEKADRRGIPIRGLIMSAVGLTIAHHGSDLYYSILIPTFTATAYAHKKLPPDLLSNLESTLRESESWMQTEYVSALTRGNTLTEGERKSFAEQMARYTGLDPEVIDKYNFRITAEQFSRELLAKEGQEVGLYDTRISSEAYDGPWDPRKDPSLRARGIAMPGLMERLYLARELGVKSDLLHAGPFGGSWPPAEGIFGDWMASKWWGYWSPLETDETKYTTGLNNVVPALMKAMESSRKHQVFTGTEMVDRVAPPLQVLMGTGIYDLATPYFGQHWVASRLKPKFKSNVTLADYESGHMGLGKEHRREAATFIKKVLATSGAEEARE
jgi:carboxypeptidase C (cathepsin A)